MDRKAQVKSTGPIYDEYLFIERTEVEPILKYSLLSYFAYPPYTRTQ